VKLVSSLSDNRRLFATAESTETVANWRYSERSLPFVRDAEMEVSLLLKGIANFQVRTSRTTTRMVARRSTPRTDSGVMMWTGSMAGVYRPRSEIFEVDGTAIATTTSATRPPSVSAEEGSVMLLSCAGYG
jgi:hypothetical protein